MLSLRPITLGVAVFACAMHAHAAPTPAGMVITNTATLDYSLEDGALATLSSNTAAFTVDELIGATLAWQDASPVAVNSPDSGDALTFLLTNTGNGTETFALGRDNAPAVSDDFDPVSSAIPIFVEANGTPGLQTGAGGDAPYAGSVSLNAGASRIVYLLSDTPGGLADGDTGQVALTAASATPGAAGATPGTILPGAGDGGAAAVVGSTRGQAAANGTYIVSGLAVDIAKIASVVGGGEAASGKTLVYTITVSVTGTGTAVNLVINDPLPAELSYVAGSIAVDSVSRTDAADADNARFSANTVTVDFGDTAAPATHVITFSATIN